MDDNGKREARHRSVSRRILLKSAATVGVTSAGTAIFAPAIVHAQNAGCGEFTLDKGGNPGDDTKGSFSASFVSDGSYGSGRAVTGNFHAVALDGGYGG